MDTELWSIINLHDSDLKQANSFLIGLSFLGFKKSLFSQHLVFFKQCYKKMNWEPDIYCTKVNVQINT